MNTFGVVVLIKTWQRCEVAGVVFGGVSFAELVFRNHSVFRNAERERRRAVSVE